MKPSNLPEYALHLFACVFDRNFGDGANLSKEKPLNDKSERIDGRLQTFPHYREGFYLFFSLNWENGFFFIYYGN
jgi:hypothetical protein